MVKDIEGTILKAGDEVYYARKRGYTANGYLVRKTITSIHVNGNVLMGRMTSTSPNDQLIKIKK